MFSRDVSDEEKEARSRQRKCDWKLETGNVEKVKNLLNFGSMGELKDLSGKTCSSFENVIESVDEEWSWK